MKYVPVKVIEKSSTSKKQYVKLLTDFQSENDLTIAEDTICEIKKLGKVNTTLLSPDGEIIILNNKLIDKLIEFI